jgi:hypothetical protein
MTRKATILLLMIICSAMAAWAQTETTLPSLRRLYQSSYINPAFIPKYKLSIGVPVLSNFYINNTRTGFTLQDAFDCKDEEGLIDLNKFHDKMHKDGIAIHTYQQMDIFHAGFTIGSFYVGLNSTLKTQASQAFSKDFIGFLVNGTTYYQGQTVSFEGLDIYTISYLENGISLARKFNKLSVGVRGKYLQGIGTTSTSHLRFGVTVPQNSYDPMVVKVGGQINTSGIPLLTNDSISGRESNSKDKDFDASNLTKFKNNGFAVDLGFVYQVLPSLQVHASVVDWGGITWKATPYNYTLNNADVQFPGFSYDQLNNSSQRSDYTDSLVDMLHKATVTDKSFRTALRTRYFAGADYDFSKRDRIGFLYQGQETPSSYNQAYTLSYTRKVGSNWDITTNYSMYNNVKSTVGLGTAVKWGAFQVFFIQDDILVYMLPARSQIFYFRFGFNLVWSELTGDKIRKAE